MILLKKFGYFAVLLPICICLLFLPITGYGQISGTIYNNTPITGAVMVSYGEGLPGPAWVPLDFTTITVTSWFYEPYSSNILPDSTNYCVLAILDSNANGEYNPSFPDFDISSMLYPVNVQGGYATGQDIYLEAGTGGITGSIYNDSGISGDVMVSYGKGVPGPDWLPVAYTTMNIVTSSFKPYNFDMLPECSFYAVLAVLDSNSNGEYNPSFPDFDVTDMFYPVDVMTSPVPGIDLHLGGGSSGEISGVIYNDTNISGNVIVYYGNGNPGGGWEPMGSQEVFIDAGGNAPYHFYDVADGSDYAVMAFLDTNSNSTFDPVSEPVAVDYPIVVQQGPTSDRDIHLEDGGTVEPPPGGYGRISGTVYNNTTMSGLVMVICGPRMSYDRWTPLAITTVTVTAGGSAPYFFDYIPTLNRLSVSAVLDVVDPFGDFDPHNGDPAGINYPLALYPCKNDITNADIYIESDVFGSVSGEIHNDTDLYGEVSVGIGYDTVSEDWVAVASTTLYLNPQESAPYNFNNIFKGIECTVTAILDANHNLEYDPFEGDPAGMNRQAETDGDKTGVDVHLLTTVFGSVSGTIYNDSTYSGPVQIAYGFGEVNLFWIPVEYSSLTINAGQSLPYSLNTVFADPDCSIIAILDVNSDGNINPCDDNVLGINYPVDVAGPVTGIDIHLKPASISGYIYDASAATDSSGTGGDEYATGPGGGTINAGGGIANVDVMLSGEFSNNCITDSNGYYELTGIQLLRDYVVTPVRPSWEFTPSSREYSVFLLPKENQDFEGSFTEEEVEEISINIGEDDAPVTIRMPDEGETKIIMPERTPEEIQERKGTVGKGDYVAVIFKSKEQEVVGKEFTIRIFNLLGEQIGDPIKKIPTSPDDTWIKWIPEDLASGIYVIHVKGPGVNFKKKVPILR
jgi:hypothetical protein